MLTLDTIIPLFSQGDWFIIIDLQDAYFHISIHPSHQKYLRFHYNTVYQFCALPFGLSTAPRTFTKCMAPNAAFLRLQSVNFQPPIDNCLIILTSYLDAIAARDTTLHTLQRLGLNINLAKSHLQPCQTVTFIGAELNSLQARAFLPQERILKINRAITPFQPKKSAHHAQHLLDLMASTTSVIQHAKLKMRALQAWILSLFDSMTDSPST